MNETPEMRGWKSYLQWEGLPFLLLVSVFGFISVLNWGYESKLIIPDNEASDSTHAHLGLQLLALAMGLALLASSFLFLVRITRPRSKTGWYMFASLTLIAILFIFPGLFLIILGPAAITMQEQTEKP